jgi:hypothetical protein
MPHAVTALKAGSATLQTRPRAALETLGLSEPPTDDIAEVATSRPAGSA